MGSIIVESSTLNDLNNSTNGELLQLLDLLVNLQVRKLKEPTISAIIEVVKDAGLALDLALALDSVRRKGWRNWLQGTRAAARLGGKQLDDLRASQGVEGAHL